MMEPSTAAGLAEPQNASQTPEASPPVAGEDGKGGADKAPPAPKKRTLRGGVTFAIGALGAFLLMGNSVQLRWGVPAGFLFLVVATCGVLDFFGTFDSPDESVAASTPLS